MFYTFIVVATAKRGRSGGHSVGVPDSPYGVMVAYRARECHILLITCFGTKAQWHLSNKTQYPPNKPASGRWRRGAGGGAERRHSAERLHGLVVGILRRGEGGGRTRSQ